MPPLQHHRAWQRDRSGHWSNQPALQFYSDNFLDGTAIVMEPQIFPRSPNQKGFPNARLDSGQTYRNVMTYRLTTAPKKR